MVKQNAHSPYSMLKIRYVNGASIGNIYVILDVLIVSYTSVQKILKGKEFMFCITLPFEAHTNSCVDTFDLRMPNNRSPSGFGYKHRPGSFVVH